jgi:Kef-type K+ transport system membrane component KefB
MTAGIFEIYPHLPILIIIGAALLFGTVGARVFQWLRIPQVVGYIAIGVVLGRSCLNVIDETTWEEFRSFNFFALGIIGFMIGGELHRDVFRKYGRQFIAILLAEGVGAFVVVGAVTTGVLMLMTRNVALSVAVGMVLGGLSAATAPAATVAVLREYKTRGVLTSAVYALVALDDGLALVLFGLASSIAGTLLAGGDAAHAGVFGTLVNVGYKIFGAIALGVLAGVGLNFIFRHGRGDHARTLTYILGSLALVMGLGRMLDVDSILAAMSLGVVVTNIAPRRSYSAFEIVERFAPPIYVLFFVLVGAHLELMGMSWWLIALAAAYVVGRSLGKVVGANFGARITAAPTALRRYLGMCLFCQGGVAVGLALSAEERFAGMKIMGEMEVGTAIMIIITATTIVVELLGPPCVKMAVEKAGEVGLDVTEEDLMESYTVADMMDTSVAIFSEGAALSEILKTISTTDAMSYPVVNDENRLVGVISLADLKQSFYTEGLTIWLVAFDLMHPAPDTIEKDAPLSEAVMRMREQDLDCLPVLAGKDDTRLLGMIELRQVNRKLSQEILRRQQLADGGPLVA